MEDYPFLGLDDCVPLEQDLQAPLLAACIESRWVAAHVVRRALEPVAVLAVPSEVVPASSVPVAPSGRSATYSVRARTGRARVSVTFIVWDEEAFSMDSMTFQDALQEIGEEVRGFGTDGRKAANTADIYAAALELGFGPEDEDHWASAAEDGAMGLVGGEQFVDQFDEIRQGLEERAREEVRSQGASQESWEELEAEARDLGEERGEARAPGQRVAGARFGDPPAPRRRAAVPGRYEIHTPRLTGGQRVQALLGQPPMPELPTAHGPSGSRRSAPLPGSAAARAQIRAGGAQGARVPQARRPGMPQDAFTQKHREAAGAKWGVEDLHGDFSLENMLAVGVEPAAAAQLALVAALERMQSGPAPKKKKRVYGLAGGGDGSGSDGESGDEESGAPTGARGAEASARLRESMERHPAKFAAEMRHRAARTLDDAEMASSPDLLLRYATEEMAIGNQRSLGYLTFGLCHVQRQIRMGNTAAADLMCMRLVAAVDQFCLDQSWKVAWPLTGLQEPSWTRWGQVDASTLRRNHAVSRLVSERWMATEVSRLKDLAFLMKMRGKGEGKGKAEAADAAGR